MATVHDFSRSLARSQSYADASWWELVYRTAFPTMAQMLYVAKDGWAQRAGVDRLITLRSSRTIKVDEKVREEEYDDFFLEIWSDRARQEPGWVWKELDCDYIAYAFVQSQRCYLLPTLDLQRAYRANAPIWKHYRRQVVANRDPRTGRSWTTEGLLVPIPIVLDAVRDRMLVTW